MTEYAGIHYLISAAIAISIALVYNYILCIVWVFNKRKLKNRILELFIYCLIGLSVLGLNELLMWIITEYVQFHYLISKIFATIVVYLWSFFARKIILFR